MSDFDIIRAWKDETYRDSLSEEQRAALPENPAGAVELADEDLAQAVGAKEAITSAPCTITATISVTLSCTFACDQTVWSGTCGASTVGCC